MTTVKDHLEFSDTVVTHLGHVLHCTLDDSEDIKRSTLEMCKKANIVLATFSSCNPHIKTILFNSHCLSLYGAALWNITCKQLNSLEVSIELCYYLVLLPQEIVGLNLTSFQNLHA